jgi:hypothetical protein
LSSITFRSKSSYIMMHLLIQVDVGGHPPIPTRSHTYFILAVSIFILAFFF